MSHRTQLHLDEVQYQFVKALAASERKSIAQLIREWIDERRTRRTTKRYAQDPLFKIRGVFKSGVPDMAEHFDEHLYGEKA